MQPNEDPATPPPGTGGGTPTPLGTRGRTTPAAPGGTESPSGLPLASNRGFGFMREANASVTPTPVRNWNINPGTIPPDIANTSPMPKASNREATGGAAASTTSLDATSGRVQARDIYDYLVNEKGVSPSKAVAVVTNIEAESGFKVNTVHDGGTGYGMFGHRDPDGKSGRRSALFKHAGTQTPSAKQQLDYLMTEPEWKQFDAVDNGGDHRADTASFTKIVESPKNENLRAQERAAKSDNYASYMESVPASGPANTGGQAAATIPSPPKPNITPDAGPTRASVNAQRRKLLEKGLIDENDGPKPGITAEEQAQVSAYLKQDAALTKQADKYLPGGGFNSNVLGGVSPGAATSTDVKPTGEATTDVPTDTGSPAGEAPANTGAATPSAPTEAAVTAPADTGAAQPDVPADTGAAAGKGGKSAVPGVDVPKLEDVAPTVTTLSPEAAAEKAAKDAEAQRMQGSTRDTSAGVKEFERKAAEAAAKQKDAGAPDAEAAAAKARAQQGLPPLPKNDRPDFNTGAPKPDDIDAINRERALKGLPNLPKPDATLRGGAPGDQQVDADANKVVAASNSSTFSGSVDVNVHNHNSKGERTESNKTTLKAGSGGTDNIPKGVVTIGTAPAAPQ